MCWIWINYCSSQRSAKVCTVMVAPLSDVHCTIKEAGQSSISEKSKWKNIKKTTLVNERELSKQSVLFNEDPDHTFYFIADQDLLCSLKTFLKNTICSSFPFSLTFKRTVCPIRNTDSRWLCTVIIRGRQATVWHYNGSVLEVVEVWVRVRHLVRHCVHTSRNTSGWREGIFSQGAKNNKKCFFYRSWP